MKLAADAFGGVATLSAASVLDLDSFLSCFFGSAEAPGGGGHGGGLGREPRMARRCRVPIAHGARSLCSGFGALCALVPCDFSMGAGLCARLGSFDELCC